MLCTEMDVFERITVGVFTTSAMIAWVFFFYVCFCVYQYCKDKEN